MVGVALLSWLLFVNVVQLRSAGIDGHRSAPVSFIGLYNISCIFHAKRKLLCDVSFHDVIDQYTCSVCPHYSTKSISECPNTDDENGCPVSKGRCMYDCDEYGYCREGHLLTIRPIGAILPNNPSTCTLIDAHKYIQPGSVRDLTLISVNSTRLKVKWKKPDDRDNDGDIYRYAVYCTNNNTHPSFIVRSRKQEVTVSCFYPEGSRLYMVSVKARPRSHGYWSKQQTASTYIREEDQTAMDKPIAHLRVPNLPRTQLSREESDDWTLDERAEASEAVEDTVSVMSLVTATLVMVCIVCAVVVCSVVVVLMKTRSFILVANEDVLNKDHLMHSNGVTSKVLLSSPSAFCTLRKLQTFLYGDQLKKPNTAISI